VLVSDIGTSVVSERLAVLPASLRVLLDGMVDFAGLFPPASLQMSEAVRRYAGYRGSSEAWALGRFVITARALSELASTVEEERPGLTLGHEPWRLAVVSGAEAEGDGGHIEAFIARSGDWARIECMEWKADSPELIRRRSARTPVGAERYFEIDPAGDLRPLLRAVRDTGSGAKIRTGGLLADAFPAPEVVLTFLRACHEIGVHFKATAGLHHPLRAAYRLTYAPDSPVGMMFGYLNIVLAAAFVAAEADDAVVLGVLTEESAHALAVGDSWISWRGRRITLDALARTRRVFARGIGSCSFREPLDDLARLEFG
jgi:hypothetical protein